MKGKLHHIASRMKISESQKRRIENQGGFSDEHRQKMSESARKRHEKIRLMVNLFRMNSDVDK